MRAMRLCRHAPIRDGEEALTACELPDPEPGPGEVVVRVHVCAVCRTDLDEVEGRLAPPRLPVVPGHQIVGTVVRLGAQVTRWRGGERVGIGWIHRASGGPGENLDPGFVATGCDVDGGYAELVRVPEQYAFALPDVLGDSEAAPLLCAGAVGYRALRACALTDGEPLGLTGFGASGHLVMQMARALYPSSPVQVFAREPAARALARELGAAWTGAIGDQPPEPPAAMLDTTPAWRPIVEALAVLRPGGRLVINAIRKEDSDRGELARLSYADHLWREKQIRSVANVTGDDVRACLLLAAASGVRPRTTCLPLADANRALRMLRRGGVDGSLVLRTQR